MIEEYELRLRIRDAAAPYLLSDGQRQAAQYLLRDLLAAAEPYGVSLRHLDAIGADLARTVVEVIRTRSF